MRIIDTLITLLAGPICLSARFVGVLAVVIGIALVGAHSLSHDPATLLVAAGCGVVYLGCRWVLTDVRGY